MQAARPLSLNWTCELESSATLTTGTLEDRLGLLSDPVAMQELEEARRAHNDGDFLSAEGVRARFGSE